MQATWTTLYIYVYIEQTIRSLWKNEKNNKHADFFFNFTKQNETYRFYKKTNINNPPCAVSAVLIKNDGDGEGRRLTN